MYANEEVDGRKNTSFVGYIADNEHLFLKLHSFTVDSARLRCRRLF